MLPDQVLSKFNVEVAHLDWGAAPDHVRRELEESVALAVEYISSEADDTKAVVVSMLIDDKVVEILDRSSWITATFDAYGADLESLVDFICFESDLGRLREELLAKVVPKYRKGIQREIERYLRKHGQIACSHDISLWHLFRLGIIGSNPDNRPTVFPTQRAVQRKLSLSNFRAEKVVSFVNDEDMRAEHRAREEILSNIEVPDGTMPLLQRIEVKGYAIDD